MKGQTIILTTAVMALFLVASIIGNVSGAYEKTSPDKSQGNAHGTSSNNNSSSSALSLSNPALNNLQPAGWKRTK